MLITKLDIQKMFLIKSKKSTQKKTEKLESSFIQEKKQEEKQEEKNKIIKLEYLLNLEKKKNQILNEVKFKKKKIVEESGKRIQLLELRNSQKNGISLKVN